MPLASYQASTDPYTQQWVILLTYVIIFSY